MNVLDHFTDVLKLEVKEDNLTGSVSHKATYLNGTCVVAVDQSLLGE